MKLLNDGNTTVSQAVVTDSTILEFKELHDVTSGSSVSWWAPTSLQRLIKHWARSLTEGTTKEVPGPRQVKLETDVVTALADLSLKKNVVLTVDEDQSGTVGDQVTLPSQLRMK